MKKINLHNKRQFAVLVDPDKADEAYLLKLIQYAQKGVDFFLVGGSLLQKDNFEKTICFLREKTQIPVYIFPGNMLQVSSKADGILLLSLISGRNPEFLIGHHVLASSALKRANIEIIPTGYILIDGGAATSVEYMSNTMPIPASKLDIITATALAGEQLGMKAIYLEAGSGAKNSIRSEIIKKVKQCIHIPLIVGGGIKTPEDVAEAFSAGANVVVMGTAVEENPSIIEKCLTMKVKNSK
ncbi:MAG: geranylgeranylglyceryl/heptaprenylglyceryl phosphate synthase [Bacteroidales bacterium]|nr:geranylgeranylglyceryl/heptaprenylglyceryl phosphate synthase [Bacteroidales bacterium]MDY0216263.1 geranylgeranylglyceryl/heptaprenylglyceryl phosphate synthase [Bacteroidales bacterium]